MLIFIFFNFFFFDLLMQLLLLNYFKAYKFKISKLNLYHKNEIVKYHLIIQLFIVQFL